MTKRVWLAAMLVVMGGGAVRAADVTDPLADGTALAGTTLIAPSGTAGTGTPTYTWNKVGASWYYLSVQNAGGTMVIQTWYAAAAVCGGSGGACAVTPAVAIGAGVTYTWWVQTYYDTGGYGPWSRGLTFTAGAPPATTLQSPRGSIGTQTPTFSWTRVTEATWYYVWVSNAGGAAVVQAWFSATSVCDRLTCSVTPAATLDAGNRHTWWVETYGGFGYGPWSTGLSFTPTAPTMTTLISPTGSIGTTTPTYRWRKVGAATWYYLWGQNRAGAPVIQTWYLSDSVCGYSMCSVTPSIGLTGANAHTWWVQTWSPLGYGTWSTPLSFTPTATLPTAATLVSPPGTGVETSPGVTFQWNNLTAATWYQLYVNSGGAHRFDQWYQAASVCGSSLCSVPTPVSLPSGSYEWWIQTWSSAGPGPWSASFTFRVASAPTSIVLTWNENPAQLDAHLLTPQIGSTSYHVYHANRGSSSSPPYALLEHDRFSFGAENIAIGQRFPGTYRYFVNNSLRAQFGAPPLAGSGAQVKIYRYDALLTTLTAPATGTGDSWQVCDIDGLTGALAGCPNTIGNQEPTFADRRPIDPAANQKPGPTASGPASRRKR
jgi:hypothetical protein